MIPLNPLNILPKPGPVAGEPVPSQGPTHLQDLSASFPLGFTAGDKPPLVAWRVGEDPETPRTWLAAGLVRGFLSEPPFRVGEVGITEAHQDSPS